MTEAPTMPAFIVSHSVAMAEAPSPAAQVAKKWSAIPGGIVDGGEIVLLAIKPSLWRTVIDSLPWLITTVAVAVILTASRTPIPGFSPSVTAQLLLMIGVGRLAFAVVRWVPSWYVLTNRRVIDIQGVRMPRVWACLLVDVRNTYLNASPAEKIASVGSITFVTNRADELPRVWRSVAEPEEVHARIRRAIENAIDQFGG